MELSEAELTEIEKFGEIFYSPDKISIVMQLDRDKFRVEVDNPESEIHKRYHKGILQSEAEIRKSIIDLANRGSSQAQEMALRFITELKIEQIH